MFEGTSVKWAVLKDISLAELADRSVPIKKTLVDQLSFHVDLINAAQVRAEGAGQLGGSDLRLEQDRQARTDSLRRTWQDFPPEDAGQARAEVLRRAFQESAQKEVAALRVVRLLLLRSQILAAPVVEYARSKTSEWIAEEEALRALRQLALSRYGHDDVEPIVRSYLGHKASKDAAVPLLDYDDLLLPSGKSGLVAYRGYLAARKKRLAAQVTLMAPAHQDARFIGIVDEQLSVREALAKVWVS